MTRIAVSGASGFIGRHLAAWLRDAGHEIIEFGSGGGDVADPETWRRLPPVDTVIHLAANTSVSDSWANSTTVMHTNILGTVAALDFCRRHRASLLFLSSYLYGDRGDVPIDEEAPLDPGNPYALSKKLAEETCAFYSAKHGVPVTVIRPFNVYGPGQSDRFLIPSVVSQLRGDEIRVKDLRPRRDYVYVADLVDAIARAVDRRTDFEVYNIGSGVSHSVAEVVDLIQSVWGTALPVKSNGPARPNEVMDTVADVSRARRCLDWTPLFSLAAGLRDMRMREGGGRR